jgi:hypothetical protein
VHSFWQKENK